MSDAYKQHLNRLGSTHETIYTLAENLLDLAGCDHGNHVPERLRAHLEETAYRLANLPEHAGAGAVRLRGRLLRYEQEKWVALLEPVPLP